MDFVQFRSPEGRPWTLKEWIQGMPLKHPTHPMFVHFPVAFYLAVVAFDIMSRITPSPALVLAGTYLLIGAFVGTAVAVVTGLIDWVGMVKGSSKKRLATQHMVLQFIAAAFFIVNFAVRWSDRTQAEADVLWIVLGIVGYLVLMVGQFLGGRLVYEKGMRVSTGARPDTSIEQP